ncbi:MAG: PAS domain S-box protein [Gallionellaceae bacterium]|jgi:PAS domain S-box-containing protein
MTHSIYIPTILIVDDTPSNLSVVVNLFEEHGYRVAIAQDGEEGLQRAQLVQPDLILLDVMMPGMDGFEACRRLKEESSTRDIPVVFMTALASSEHKVRGFGAGAVDYVTKPLQIDEVMARVDTHLKLSAAQKKLAEHNEELERRVAERTAELAAREREFRTLVENAPDVITRHDRQCRYFYTNPQHEKTLGISMADVAGRTPAECFPGNQDVVAYQALMMKVIETGLPGEYAATLPDDGSGPRYHSILLVAERDANNQVTGVLAIGRDITAIKRAEEQLAMLGAAIDHAHEAAYFVDEHGGFFYVNEEASRMLGYSREALLGMTVMDIAPGWTRQVMAESWQAISKVGAVTIEAEHRHKDGGIIPVEINITHMNYGGRSFNLAMVRDIAERKRDERELHLLNRALDQSFDATYLIDTDLRIRYVNEAAVRELGYSREELLSMTLLDIDPNVTREMVQRLMAKTETSGRFPGAIELRHRRKNGEIFPVEIGATLFSYEGEILHLTVVRNITERKEAERRLHEKSQAIRAVVENSPDAIARYDRQLRRTYVNPATQALYELPFEEIVGRTFDELPPLPTPIDDFASALKSVFELGQERQIELPFRKPNGEMGWGDMRIVPEFGPDGIVVSVLSIARDITERKRAEEDLAEREQRYREIFDNAVEGMYLLEVTEDGRFRNLDINPALAASTGIPREAMIGQFVDDAIPGDAGKLIVAKYRRCVAAGKTITENIELDLPAGKHHYYSTITPIYYAGRIHRLIGISRDITELKKAERELQESREQLRGLTARREAAREEERKYIAREVHDELGQVLTGLQLNISVLEHKFVPGLPPLHEHLQETKILTDRALAVARNVASALRPAALDLGINSALEWLAGRFSTNTGIQCKVHVSKDEIHIDESHATALFRIVQESLTNVSRHAKASRVDVTFGNDGDDYLLSVCDNGKGFETDTRKLDSYGLVGIKERALMLGGTVIIESKPGKGTQISVRIPLNQAGEA